MNNKCYCKKTGILGGTFNPIHNGHIYIAEKALENLGFDEVMFIPSGCSYMKDPKIIAATEHRIRMTELAIKNNARFKISLIETEREGNSYTYETLELLKQTDPQNKLYYIIGEDTLMYMDSWAEPERIFANCTIVCAKRDDRLSDEIKDKAGKLKKLYNADIVLMNIKPLDVSSTMIRGMIAKGRDCSEFLDENVYEYIKKNGLYVNDSN